jgi:transposase-like protein
MHDIIRKRISLLEVRERHVAGGVLAQSDKLAVLRAEPLREELLFERGVIVSYETIRSWCDKFGRGLAQRVKSARRKPGTTWHLDELYVTLRGEPYLLCRAVDEHGAELDILVQRQRDKPAAKRFFKRVPRSKPVPRKIVTDQLRSYPGGQSRDPGARKREARVRQSGRPGEQSRREQPSTDA